VFGCNSRAYALLGADVDCAAGACKVAEGKDVTLLRIDADGPIRHGEDVLPLVAFDAKNMRALLEDPGVHLIRSPAMPQACIRTGERGDRMQELRALGYIE